MSGSGVDWPAELAVMEAETMGEESMVARVARAAYDAMVRQMGQNPSEQPNRWQDQPQRLRDDWLFAMGQALRAMREPTEAMLKAGEFACGGDIPASWLRQPWRGMIDAALEDR